MDFIFIKTDEELIKLSESFSGLPYISVDFECEFNLHIYGEHLCLIQIFDGSKYYIVDNKSQKLTVKGLDAFFSTDVLKLWFEAHSDLQLVRRLYNLEIRNVYDIRVLAKLLSEKGSLSFLIEKYLDVDLGEDKKKNQMANWLVRPLDPDLIQYALNDVKYLPDLRVSLLKKIEEEKISLKNIDYLLKKAVSKTPIKPPYTKLTDWRKLDRKQKIFIKHFYFARDSVAKRFNKPSFYILDKKKLVDAAIKGPKTEVEAFELFGQINSRYLPYLKESFSKAYIQINEEMKNEV